MSLPALPPTARSSLTLSVCFLRTTFYSLWLDLTAHCLPVDTLLRRTPGELHILDKHRISSWRLAGRRCRLGWIGALFHYLLSYLSAAVNSVLLHCHEA
jgi:hypothetical protein